LTPDYGRRAAFIRAAGFKGNATMGTILISVSAVRILVDDIDGAYRNLVAKGVPFPAPPELQPWGGTLAFPRDPDGNILTLAGRRSL
jgi:uncharacterized glyoxalase superfamily protein PhnB